MGLPVWRPSFACSRAIVRSLQACRVSWIFYTWVFTQRSDCKPRLQATLRRNQCSEYPAWSSLSRRFCGLNYARPLSTMNYKRAIREALRLFPSEMEVVLNKPDAPSKAHSPSLSKAWSLANELADRQSDWHYIAVWAIGCALHRVVQQAAGSGKPIALKRDIDMRYLENKFAQSLLTPNTWFPRHIKRAYCRDRAFRGVPRYSERGEPTPTNNE